MSKPFNYSKWDNIELSDDESDLHPNIDKDSWFRLKHRTRLEREDKEDQEIKDYNQKNATDLNRIKILKARIGGFKSGQSEEDAEFEDIDAMEAELKDLQQDIDKRNTRIADINERRKWNIDNICKVKEEKTVVNAGKTASLKAEDTDPVHPDDSDNEEQNTEVKTVDTSTTGQKETGTSLPKPQAASTTTTIKPPAVSSPSSSTTSSSSVAKATTVRSVGPAPPGSTTKRERFSAIAYNDFAQKYEELLETYSEIDDMEGTKEYLFKHCDVLLHDHAQSYMLLSSLEDEMNGKHKRMKLVCRQSQILSQINDLGKSMNRDPRDVIVPFFFRLQEKEHLLGFTSAVQDFVTKIEKRAVEKRKEMDEEAREEARKQNKHGLDPYEVLQSLPEELRSAFESQSIERLQQVIAEMDPAEAKHWMKLCVDSGLWVPNNKEIFEDEDDQEDKEDKED